MSEAKHTPGPLRVITPANNDGEFPIEKDDGSMEPVAFVVSKNEADAHLFAAAPDLLASVKLFRDTIEYLIKADRVAGDDEGARLKSFTLESVKDLIAKAEGRS